MSDYPIHPIAACYPPLSPEDYEEFKEDIRKNKLLHPVIIFDGQILCGVHRARACKELGIELRTETPEISNPVAYAIADNEIRRNLSKAERAFTAAKLANMPEGGTGANQYANFAAKPMGRAAKLSQAEAATKMHVSLRSTIKARRVISHGVPELEEAVDRKDICLRTAEQIAALPKDKQLEELAKHTKAKAEKPAPNKPKQPKPKKPEKLKWTPEEEAENEDCLAIINAPSKFPHDAPISRSMNNSEAHLRGHIIWLRENEGKIASFNRAQVFEMQVHTNGVQAYKVNWAGFARPDGDVDERIIDWAQDLWLRQRKQEIRLDLLGKLRPPRKKKEKELFARKAQRSFEDRFKTFWMLVEDSLEQLFKPHESLLVIRRFKQEAKQFFSTLSGENRGAAVVADAQKSVGPENSNSNARRNHYEYTS